MREGILRQGVRHEGIFQGVGYEVDTTGEPLIVRLLYLLPEGGEPMECQVGLQTTGVSWGGGRWWFTCPLACCGRRVQKLYLPPEAQFFLCRHCHHLEYESRRQDVPTRVLWKMAKIEARLGTKKASFARPPPKPPRMWRSTYEKLVDQFYEAEMKAWAHFGLIAKEDLDPPQGHLRAHEGGRRARRE